MEDWEITNCLQSSKTKYNFYFILEGAFLGKAKFSTSNFITKCKNLKTNSTILHIRHHPDITNSKFETSSFMETNGVKVLLVILNNSRIIIFFTFMEKFDMILPYLNIKILRQRTFLICQIPFILYYQHKQWLCMRFIERR